MEFYSENWKQETTDTSLIENITGEFLGNSNDQDFSINGVVNFGSTLQVIGISSFSDQVHITGAVGIGTTNPGLCGQLEVVGVVCANDFNCTSDATLKTNLNIIPQSLEKVLQLNGYTFNWKDSNKKSAGVVAQELEKVLPELVGGFQQKTVNYNGIIAVLIESIKELNAKVEKLTTDLESAKMSS